MKDQTVSVKLNHQQKMDTKSKTRPKFPSNISNFSIKKLVEM